MVLIRIGNFEINPEQIKFIDNGDKGAEIIFNTDLVLSIDNDSDAYVDLQMFITNARYYYMKPVANEESQSEE